MPNENQYESYKQEIKLYLPNIEEKCNEVSLLISAYSKDDPLKFICGKYLLTSLCSYLNNKSSIKYKYDKLKAELISRINPESFIYLKNKIINCLT